MAAETETKKLTIAGAMSAVSDEYNAEVHESETNHAFARLMAHRHRDEYREIDRELPDYVAEIAQGMGVKTGTILPDYVYVACRMCFRFGMRVQRKMDRPDEKTSMFWQGDVDAH